MQIKIKREGVIMIVSLTGELDHHCADEVRRKIDGALLANVSRYVIFDFTGLSFMDSSGIGMLMGRYKNIGLLGGKAWIVCGSGEGVAVEKLLAMSGVFKYIKKADSVKGVMESLRGVV